MMVTKLNGKRAFSMYQIYDARDGLGWTFAATQRHYKTASAAALAAQSECQVLLAQVAGQVGDAVNADESGYYQAAHIGDAQITVVRM